ncbi:MAG: LPS export ABC transporter periplasmic protein LptC, partial [Endomicrobiia bacterium]
ITSGSIRIYDKNTNYLASVNFLSAFLFLDNYDIFFKDKNIIHTVENEKIITYDMRYITKENRLVSDKEIIIYKGETIIRGVGFETKDGFKTIKIWKNVITEG